MYFWLHCQDYLLKAQGIACIWLTTVITINGSLKVYLKCVLF